MIIVERARSFAAKAHEGQVRKYTGEPYINHPAEVVGIMAPFDFHPRVLAAAWLHDTIEDCGVTADEIAFEFGPDVALLVLQVTDVSRPDHGNRAVRKVIDRDHLAKADYEGQSIKLADLISNTKSIVARDPDFAKVYLREKDELLEVLTRGHPELWRCAAGIIGTDRGNRTRAFPEPQSGVLPLN